MTSVLPVALIADNPRQLPKIPLRNNCNNRKNPLPKRQTKYESERDALPPVRQSLPPFSTAAHHSGVKSVLLALALASPVAAADLFPFQLPWDDSTPSITNISFLNDKPAGRDGFVHVKDGHLFAGEKRLRIFGVNVCFGANFPDKEMAPKIAARMAKFGINCVRFHHMDMMNTPSGIFAKDGKTLDPGQLDRLDWFIAKLKENGIYADLNLHVSRTYPDRPRAEKKGNPDYDKGVDNYCAAMIALQKEYARDLLTHVNPYTGKSYAEEPAVALVEINNENALGLQWWAGEMDALPEVYRVELEKLWGAWLTKKYTADEKATAAWAEGARDGGSGMIHGDGTAQAAEAQGSLAAKWYFESHEGAVTKGTVKGDAISFSVEKPGNAAWHAQFGAAGLTVEKDERYEVRFRVKAPKETSISVTLMQAHEPWKQLGNTSVNAGTEWREVSAMVKAADSDTNARLTIGGMGFTTGTFEFSGFSLRKAPIQGKLERDAAGNVPMILKRELARHTFAKQRDWQEFIWDTEIAYWNGMRDFLKKELGVKAPIVGTQGFWSPGHVQAGMDVIDSHAYWQHPDFHGRGWNQDVWSVKNLPMAGAKDGGTLPGLAAQRVEGKPFICTEYNHAAPNTYSAETFPLLCAFAALQDWDGIFAFSYSHRGPGDWGQEYVNNFFDIDRHPVKMATLPGAVLSFRRGDLASDLGTNSIQSLNRQTALEAALKSGPNFAFNERFRHLPPSFPDDRLSFKPTLDGNNSGGSQLISKWQSHATVPFMRWENEAKLARLDGNGSTAMVGALTHGTQMEHFTPKVTPGETRQNWACYQFTAFDGKDLSTAKRLLITATGDIENTDQKWTDATKSSVARNWGKAPVLVEGPAAKIEIPGTGKLKAWALDERGQRRTEIPMTGNTLEIGPQHKTLWYEVERQ